MKFLHVPLVSFLFEVLIFLDPELLQMEDTTSPPNYSLLPELCVASLHLKDSCNQIYVNWLIWSIYMSEEKQVIIEQFLVNPYLPPNQLKIR